MGKTPGATEAKGKPPQRETRMRSFLHSLVRLWLARDELSVRNIRLRYLHYFLPIVLVLILLDQRNTLFFDVLPGGVFGFDLATLVYGAYCLGSLTVLLFFLKERTCTPRVFAAIALAGFLLWLLLPGYALRPAFILVFQFGLGGCAIYATYAYVFVLRNAERLFGILLVTFNYGLFIHLQHEGVNTVFLAKVLPLALVVLLSVCIFRFRRADFPDTGRTAALDPPRGIYSILIFGFAFFAINVFGEATVGQGGRGFDLRGIGAMLAVLVSLTIQFVFRRSVWQMINLFLMCTTAGIALMALVPSAAEGGALLFGVGDGLGYIMTFYMTGVIKRYSSDGFFKRITLSIVVAMIVAIVACGAMARWQPAALPGTAAGVAGLFLCVFLVLSPVLHRNVFAADWMDDYRSADITALANKLEALRPADNPLPVDLFGDFIRRVRTLTPTERVIFNYCLEGRNNQEMIGLMYISLSTLKTHHSHIYSKLNISSRDELSLYIELIKKSGRLADIQQYHTGYDRVK